MRVLSMAAAMTLALNVTAIAQNPSIKLIPDEWYLVGINNAVAPIYPRCNRLADLNPNADDHSPNADDRYPETVYALNPGPYDANGKGPIRTPAQWAKWMGDQHVYDYYFTIVPSLNPDIVVYNTHMKHDSWFIRGRLCEQLMIPVGDGTPLLTFDWKRIYDNQVGTSHDFKINIEANP
jgi:hypothetical protein